MTATQIHIRFSRLRLGEPAGWIPVLIAAGWTVVAVGVGIGGGRRVELALLLVPAALAVAAFLGTGRRSPTLPSAAVWTCAVGAAFQFTPALAADPTISLAVPAITVVAWASAKRPAISVTTIMALTGFYGTLQIRLGLPVGTLIDFLLVGLWASVAWNLILGQRREALTIWLAIAAVGLYLAITVLAIPFSSAGIGPAVKSFHNTAWYMLALPLIVLAPWERATRMRIAQGIVLVAFAVGAYACVQILFGPSTQEKDYVALLPQNGGIRNDLGVFGSFLSKKELSAWLAPVVPFTFAFVLFARGSWRTVAVVALGLCTVSLFATGARQPAAVAVLGMVFSLLLYQFARGFPGLHLGRTLLFGLLLAGGIGVSYTIGNPHDAQRSYSAIFNPGNERSFQQRQQTWATVIREIPKKPLGHGLGTAGGTAAGGDVISTAGQDLDNSYLVVAFQQGMAVMVLFVLSILLLLVSLTRAALLAQSPATAGLGIASAGTLLAFVSEFYGTQAIEFFPALVAWIIVGLGVAELSASGTRTTSPDAKPKLEAARATIASSYFPRK